MGGILYSRKGNHDPKSSEAPLLRLRGLGTQPLITAIRRLERPSQQPLRGPGKALRGPQEAPRGGVCPLFSQRRVMLGQGCLRAFFLGGTIYFH